MPIRITTVLFLVPVLALALVACDGPTSELSTAQVAPKSTYDVVRDDVPKWLEYAANSRAESASLKRELARPVAELQSLNLQHVTTMRALYGVREHRPIWVDLTTSGPARLSAAGTALREALAAAHAEHGFYDDQLHRETLGQLFGAAEGGERGTFEDVRFEAAELKLVQEWADGNPDATPEELAMALGEADGPTPRLAAMIGKRVDELRGDSRERVRLDLYLTDALVEYGMQMKWNNPAWHEGVEWPEHLQAPETDTRLGWQDLRKARRDLLAMRTMQPVFSAPGEVDALLATLQPRMEQYERLKGAFVEYAKIVADGGWEKLPEDAGGLKLGDEGEGVAALKRRLRAEGYWKGDDGPRFTESLVEALEDYQRTHQLWEKGVLSRETKASLDVSAERRLAQIRVALQRWRDSAIADDEHYVFVNIPDFHVEVWKDGERKMRFKSVVGATTHERDPDSGAFEYVHRTPTLTSQIEHVVLNPYWWVPRDIATNELEPQIEKNPFWLKENGYEYAANDRGEATLRQRPGPNNALGKVKINFPNDHQVYMHDTPEKNLFRWPARAFSHGCIRLENPMEFAKYLLEADGQWDQDKVDGLLEAGAEKWLTLSNPVPVHVEYYVVRVDDLGRANFLADLYREDARLMSAAMKRGEETVPTAGR